MMQHPSETKAAAAAENTSTASNVVALPLAKRLSREQLSFTCSAGDRSRATGAIQPHYPLGHYGATGTSHSLGLLG